MGHLILTRVTSPFSDQECKGTILELNPTLSII